jgi:glutathione reductase (NADPH)
MATSYDYDFFVIGGGSGGVRAARTAAGFGARVGLAEVERLGGTCVNVGCIPKKLLVYSSEFSRDFRDAEGFGWSVPEATHDWARLIENKDDEIRRLNGVYARLLNDAGVRVHVGHATLEDPHTVRIGEERVRARYVLLAPGGVPYVPESIPRQHVITSNEAFTLPEFPRRVVVVGGGYIAVEFAGIFHGLGAEVHLVHRRSLLLRGFDLDVREHLTNALAEQGIHMHVDRELTSVERMGDELVVKLTEGRTLYADQVLCAVGRRPRTAGLGLERVGVEVDAHGALRVDAYSKTNVDNIYAVGDATDRIALTPVALAEGAAVAHTLFNDNPTRPDHENVPSAVFSHPSVGTVGLTEQDACERYPHIDIYKSHFRELKHTVSGRAKKTLMKLVVDRDSERVLGVHMVGDHAGEIVQGFAVAIKMGATKRDFDRTIGIHPTAAEEFVTMRKVERR